MVLFALRFSFTLPPKFSVYKTIIILYIVCFGCFVLFSRSPDYFYSEQARGFIQFNRSNKSMEAYYAVGNTSYIVNASHPLTKLKHGEAVTIIYDPSMPEKGVVYSLWSYWISLPELALSVGLLAVLFLSSVFITGKNSNIPYTPEQLQKKRKYDL